jgi:hypothetical protein
LAPLAVFEQFQFYAGAILKRMRFLLNPLEKHAVCADADLIIG